MYDGTVFEYLVAQDEECKLLTVGSWYAMTGYAPAFPRNSKHYDSFNRKIMDYSENGNSKSGTPGKIWNFSIIFKEGNFFRSHMAHEVR